MGQSATIYALASAVGQAGVAVVRLSGATAIAIADRLVADTAVSDFPPRMLRRVRIVDPSDNTDIDHAMAVVFPAPYSFTGEDVVEWHCHGSRAVIDKLFTALECAGASLAEPGAFCKRAFVNGKMDLTQSEGVMDLINAETAMQMRQAQYQSQGGMRQKYTQWANTLLPILAHYEAYMDFPDEDLPADVAQNAFAKIDGLVADMDKHLHCGGISERIRSGIQVAVIGDPNAGKSSLVNTLAKRDVAIVSPTAGTTRDVIEVHLDIGGYAVRVLDTAGVRHSTDAVESEGIKRAIDAANNADIVVLVADGSDVRINEGYVQSRLSTIDNPTAAVIVVANKSEKSDFKAPSAAENIFCVSALTEQGLEAFISHLKGLILKRFAVPSEPMITRHRHRVALQQCVEYITRAKSAASIELTAEELRLAVRALGKITGQVDVEHILDIVFADFCIGK